jgi:hypothetical protein
MANTSQSFRSSGLVRTFLLLIVDAFGGEKTVQDALQGLELNEVGDCLPGMEVSLLTHQIIGGKNIVCFQASPHLLLVNWMKMREDEGAKFARGGILADAMGLGESYATYVFAFPDSHQGKRFRPLVSCVQIHQVGIQPPGDANTKTQIQTIRTARRR